MNRGFSLAFTIISILTSPLNSMAQTHKGMSFQGVIKMPNSEYPTASGVTVQAKILSSNGCILRAEEFQGVNISNGYINLVIGTGSLTADDPGLTLRKAMDNSAIISGGPTKPGGLVCLDGNGNVSNSTSFDPTNTSGIRKFRIELSVGSMPLKADFNMRSVAYALNSESLNGKTESNFVQTSTNITQTKAEDWFASTVMGQLLAGTYNAATADSAATALTALNVTGTVAIANGGTGGTTASAARTNLGLGSLATMTPTGTADNSTYLRGDGIWAAVPGGVSSVAGKTGVVTLNAADLTDFNSAADARITAQKGQTNGLATLDGSGKVPSTQLALTASDIPNLDAAKITTGTLTQNVSSSSVSGTTGSFTNLRIYDGASQYLTMTLPTGGTGYTLKWPNAVGGAGQVLQTDATGNLSWVSMAAGTVTSVSSANTDISVATGTTTPVMTLNSGTAGGAGDANKIPKLDGSGLLAVNMIPNLSAAKITSGILPIANGGTNSSTALNNNRVMVSSGSKIVETSAITASRALASDANGLPVASTATATELGYLSGTTSSIQTQLNAKSSSSGWANYSVIGTNGTGAMTAIAGSAVGSILQYSVTGPVYSTATYPSSTTGNQLLYSSSNNVVGGLTSANNSVLTTNASGVPSWSPLSDDVFTQYARLAGRSGGQTLTGGTSASENLVLESTSNATKGNILINPNGGSVGIGESAPGVSNVLMVRKDHDEATRIVVKNMTDGVNSRSQVQLNNNNLLLNVQVNAPTFSGAPLTGGAAGAGIWTPSATTGGMAIGTTVGSLRFLSGFTERMRIEQTGNIGIGTSTPAVALDVAGSINIGSQATRTTATTSRGQLASGSTFKKTSTGSTTLNADDGNIQEVESFLCNGTNTITFSNMKDGGAYTVLLSGTAAHSGICVFAHSGLVFKTSGGNIAPVSGKDVLFTFAVIGTTVIYSMVDNLQ